jgi:hypothetical protein
MKPDYSDNTKKCTEDNGFDPRDITHVLYAQRNPLGTPRRHRIVRKPMGRSKKNWCPDCQAYMPKNHVHGKESQ